MNEEKLKLVEKIKLNTGLLWPHIEGKKAWSISALTKILKDEEYKDIPEYILINAANRGKFFHEHIQKFLETGIYPEFIDAEVDAKTLKLQERILKTIIFIERKKINEKKFLGSETLNYIFYKEELIACYSDLEFENSIIELKTNHHSYNKKPLMILYFELQLLIQYLCTKKNIYILWNTERGIYFNKFSPTETLIIIFDLLIDINKELIIKKIEKINKEEIIKKVTEMYLPLNINFSH